MEEDENDTKERCRKEDRRAQVKKEWGMSEEKKVQISICRDVRYFRHRFSCKISSWDPWDRRGVFIREGSLLLLRVPIIIMQ